MADVTVAVAVTVPSSLAIGQTAKAVARITTDVDDGSLDTRVAVWSSSAPAIASVDATGLVKAMAAGSAVIRAAVGTVTGQATVTVSVPVIDLSLGAAGIEAALLKLTTGQQAVLRGPTTDFDVRVG